MDTFEGELPADENMGWGFESDIYSGLKNFKDFRALASERKRISQYEITRFLVNTLKAFFSGGSERRVRGSGREYNLHKR